jgi:hypothetical protein
VQVGSKKWQFDEKQGVEKYDEQEQFLPEHLGVEKFGVESFEAEEQLQHD